MNIKRFFIKIDQKDNKILFGAVVVTVVILGFILNSSIQKQTVEQASKMRQPSEAAVLEKTGEGESQPEKVIAEGLFLEVTSPAPASTVSSPSLEVRGKTEPDAEVFINEMELTADSQGNFAADITLEEGKNVIVITASDADGRYAEQELTVTYEPSN